MNAARPVRRLGPLLLVLALTGGGILLIQTTAAARARTGPAGDPGGRVLAELATLKADIPSHAVALHTFGNEPHLTNSCQTSQPGVQEVIAFDSRQSVQQVQEIVATKMRLAGWRHLSRIGPAEWYDDISGQQVEAENYLARWSRQFPQKVTASATLQVGIPVIGWKPGDVLHWSLGALANGVGEPNMHCGEG